ncbi:MAG TPA: enoyl-CoA hydratase [Erythrobacter sp.]|nr:enoyl-CoA hydratase [Erythrobacter sp.]
MSAKIKSEDSDGVRLLTITNPPRGYMDSIVCAELVEYFAAAVDDEEVKAIVFTGGVEGVFIRHYDVKEILAMGHAVRNAGSESGPAPPRSETPVYDLLDRMLACPKPLIAAINGTCMGGGCEFALGCDIRVASRGDYTIGLPEARLGIVPGLGGMQMLARVVGITRAKEMALRGRVIGPEESHRIGLVDELGDDAVATAMEIAKDLATLSPVALASIKQMAAQVASGETLEEGTLSAAENFLLTLTANGEAMKRMQRFVDEGEDILAR